jgi:hypothetical protein
MEASQARRQVMSAAFNQICGLLGHEDAADEAALTDVLHRCQQQLEEAKATPIAELH